MNVKSLAAAALCSILMGGAPAWAADCGPLKLVATMDLLPGPGGGPRVMVPVVVNNVPQKMLLSTAGGLSTLNAEAAKNLNLHVLHGSNVRLLDTAGNASDAYVTLDTFTLGRLTAEHLEMLITPGAAADRGFDGVLAGDLMARYDVELDFAAHKMNFFSPDHCEGKVLYWPASTIAVVPFTMTHPDNTPMGQRPNFSPLRDSHIRVPVTLDGKTFQAVINTGSPNSTMSAKVAERIFNLTADSPGSVPLGVVDNNPKNRRFGHVFQKLTFEGIDVANAHVVVIPDLIGTKDPNNTITTGSLVQHIDDGLGSEVSIGMDVLRHLHLYIAYGEHKLYITPADSPAAAGGATSPTPAAAQ